MKSMYITIISSLMLSALFLYVVSININHNVSTKSNSQTYHHIGVLVNNDGVQCDVKWCAHFKDKDSVVFVEYNIIQDIRNGLLCRVSC